jgi:hypothetical protein
MLGIGDFNMTDLMKRYEKETGESSVFSGISQEPTYKYVAWLEAQLTPIPVTERLPDSGQEVLAHYNDVTVRATYIHRFTEECNDLDCENYEYNEEDDEFYINEGWYELMDNWGDFRSIAIVEGTVDSWLPIPPMNVSNDSVCEW